MPKAMISFTSVVLTYADFDNNSENNPKFTKYVKEGCGLDFGRDFSINFGKTEM